MLFRVPLPFAYRWCTDYRPEDGRLSGEGFERRVLRRSRRRVVLEDLWWEADGWRWRRNEVTLSPPDRWSTDSPGNVRVAHLDYRLTPVTERSCFLDLVMRRRPGARDPRQPSKQELERELETLWGHYRRAMEREYRHSVDRD